MKPVLFYGVVRRVYGPGWEVMAVTTAKPRRLWGRTAGDEPTNRAPRDLLARFPTEELATEALMVAGRVHASFADDIKRAEEARRKAVDDRTAAVASAIATLQANAPLEALAGATRA